MPKNANGSKLKRFLRSMRSLFPMSPAKRELAEIQQHRDLVKLSPVEAEKRELLLKDALDTGSMVALAGTENRIAQMVAEQTRGFRKELGDLHGHISALSQRIMYLEQPERPKLGEVGSGTGVFPRSGRKGKSHKSEIAGRPGRLKDAVAEGVAGEMARREAPSTLEAQRETNDQHTRQAESRGYVSDGRYPKRENLQIAGAAPPLNPYPDARDGLRSGMLHTSRIYACGCEAHGPGDVPNYCPTHGTPPETDLSAARRMASAGGPLINLPDACCGEPAPPDPYIQTR